MLGLPGMGVIAVVFMVFALPIDGLDGFGCDWGMSLSELGVFGEEDVGVGIIEGDEFGIAPGIGLVAGIDAEVGIDEAGGADVSVAAGGAFPEFPESANNSLVDVDDDSDFGAGSVSDLGTSALSALDVFSEVDASAGVAEVAVGSDVATGVASGDEATVSGLEEGSGGGIAPPDAIAPGIGAGGTLEDSSEDVAAGAAEAADWSPVAASEAG